MDSVKAKNFIIIVLLIINIALLSLIASDAIQTQARRNEAIEGSKAILVENGVTVSANADLGQRKLSLSQVVRDLEQERQNVKNVLGDVAVTDKGGNIIFYSGESGQGEFRGTGSFNILMNEPVYPAGDDAVAVARDFAKKLGLSVMRGEEAVTSDVVDGAGTVMLYCMTSNVRVLNCRVTFTFAGGSLNLVSGSRPFDTVTVDKAVDTLDVPTVLMRFLSIINSEGYICSQLNEVELCYHMTSPASGEGSLIPVWRLVTDAGELYINGLTGKNENIL